MWDVIEPDGGSGAELTHLTLQQASEAMRSGRTTARALVAASLARIASVDQELQAFATVCSEQALAAAELLDSGPWTGPLHGIPIAIKDNIDTAGVVTACGSAARDGHLPDRNAQVVDYLVAAGAVVVGKARTHEFAFGGICPPTVNFVDPERIAGGSSGGSAVAVASGMVYGAVGTDTGGSIRIPAAYNGVTALKPTYARVPASGVTPLSWSLDHVGPMARTVDDVALLFTVMCGPGEASRQVPHQQDSGALDRHRDLRGLRLAVPSGYFREQVDPAVLAAVDAAAEALAGQGATLVHTEVQGLERAAAAYRTIVGAEAATYHEAELRQHRDLYGAAVRVRLDEGLLISASQYIRAQRLRAEIGSALKQVFIESNLHGLLFASQPMVAPRHGVTRVEFPGGPPLDLLQRQLRHGMPFNLAGLPVLTVPCGQADGGLPVGISIAGRHNDEQTLFQVGRAVEHVVPQNWTTKVQAAD